MTKTNYSHRHLTSISPHKTYCLMIELDNGHLSQSVIVVNHLSCLSTLEISNSTIDDETIHLYFMDKIYFLFSCKIKRLRRRWV